jgi:hypothetical protein
MILAALRDAHAQRPEPGLSTTQRPLLLKPLWESSEVFIGRDLRAAAGGREPGIELPQQNCAGLRSGVPESACPAPTADVARYLHLSAVTGDRASRFWGGGQAAASRRPRSCGPVR